MAKKKGQGPANKGARPSTPESVNAKAQAEGESKPGANQVKTKAAEKNHTSLKDVNKDKQASGNNANLNKAAAAKEPMNKDKDKESEKKSLGDTIGDILQFLKEVNVERRKISWPGREQVIRETWSVLFLVAIITGLVLGFDWFLGHVIFGPLEHWARLHGGGIGRG